MECNSSNKKYKLAIVLCASVLNDQGSFSELGKEKQTGDPIYIGGQIRMQAAVDIQRKVEKFIVVGGGAKERYECSDFKKVNDMKQFLCCENNIELERVIRIASEADTTGNLHAIKKLNILQNLKDKDVAIITNFYHLPRAMLMASRIFKGMDINFIPISAEAVIEKCHPSYNFYPKEFLFRIYKEISGLRDWENEIYGGKKKWGKKLEGWHAHCHKEDESQLGFLLGSSKNI